MKSDGGFRLEFPRVGVTCDSGAHRNQNPVNVTPANRERLLAISTDGFDVAAPPRFDQCQSYAERGLDTHRALLGGATSDLSVSSNWPGATAWTARSEACGCGIGRSSPVVTSVFVV